MSRLLITIAVDAADDPLGAKESAVMALEPLGGIQVLGWRRSGLSSSPSNSLAATRKGSLKCL